MFKKIGTLSLITILLTAVLNISAFAKGTDPTEPAKAQPVRISKERLNKPGTSQVFDPKEKMTMAEYESQKAKGRGMSTGTKVAIGIGIAVGVIAILAIAVKNTDIHPFN